MRRLEGNSGASVYGLVVLVLVTVVAVALVSASSARAGLLGANILVNPGAEDDIGATQFGCNAEPCSSPGPHNDPPQGWTIPDPGGNFTAVQYAAPGSPPPPAGGGAKFFAGGYRPGPYTATQSIDVSPLATQIDATSVQADLSGQLAGYSGESASPKVTASFYSGATCSGTPLGSTSITIAAGERNLTFFSRSSSARLPVGTRLVCVVMEPDGSITDYGDIYFDNLSLMLTEVAPLPATPPTTTPPPATTTPPTTTTPPNININVNVAPNITTAITTGAPFPSPAIPATTDVNYNPQTGQFFIRIKYKIREAELKRLCRRGCPATVETRSRTGRRLFGGLPGDGAVLGSKSGIRIRPTRTKLRIDVPINKGRLLNLDFTTVGGFRVGETRTRVILRTPAGDALTVRDGRIRVSIARIQSGALPGLQGILAL